MKQPGPSLPTAGLGAGVGAGRAAQLDRIGQQRFPGCDLAKGLSLGILWPFLGTLSWSLAQVLGKNEHVGAGEGRREKLCSVPGFRGLGSTVDSQEVPGRSLNLSRLEA